MANTFTGVLQTVVAQSLMALREQALITRFINRDYENTPQTWGDTVNVTIPAPATVYSVSPSSTPKAPTDFTPVKVAIALDQWKGDNMAITDKDIGMITAGIMPSQLSELVKGLGNNVNAYFYQLYKSVYGFAGTPGAIPFNAGTTADIVAARKVLNQQLAPMDPRTVILDIEAEAKALAVSDIVRSDARGEGSAITEGRIARSFGMSWFMDQLVPRHVSTVFTAGAVTVNGVNAIGAGSTDNGRTGTISIAKITNTSPLVKGDILTFAGDTQTYVVLADVTLIVGNTTVSIAPALKVATAGAEAVTLKASHTVNLVFSRDAFYFASRPLSSLRDTADTFSMVDPVTGIALRAEMVRQSKQTLLELDILYGGACVRPEFAVRLAGQ